MLYPFSALLARMKYITRWSLMHSTRAESLSEHTCDTALLAHMLCLIARRYTGTPCRPKTVAVAALYHDAPFLPRDDPFNLLEKFFFLCPHLRQFIAECGKCHLFIHKFILSHLALSRSFFCAVLPL